MSDHDHGAVTGFQTADDRKHLPRQLGVEGGGGLVEAEDVGGHTQGSGDGHALLLTARKLAGVGVGLLRKPHAGKKCLGLLADGGVLLRLEGAGGVAALFLADGLDLVLQGEGGGQHEILHDGVLGEEVEGLEDQTEVQAVAADLGIGQGVLVGCVQKKLAAHRNAALVGGLEEVETAEQGGLAAARGADDGQHVPLVQGQVDALQHLDTAEALADALDG